MPSNAADLVARFAQVTKCADDGQRCADGSFVEKARVVPAANLVQLVISGEWSTGGLLVRCDDVDAAAQPFHVARGHILAGAAVDHDGVWQVLGMDVVGETRPVQGFRVLVVEILAPRRQVDGPVAQEHAARAGDGAHAEIQVELGLEPGNFRGHLLQEHLADVTGADDADGDSLGRREVEARMHGPQRPGRVLPGDHGRNVPLRRALGNRHDVDARASQGSKKAASDARHAGHSVAHDGYHAARVLDRHALNEALLQLHRERPLHHPLCLGRHPAGDADADGVLRTSLRDENYRDAGFAERAKQAVRRSGDANHARPPQMFSRATSSTAVTPLMGCRGSELGPMRTPGRRC